MLIDGKHYEEYHAEVAIDKRFIYSAEYRLNFIDYHQENHAIE